MKKELVILKNGKMLVTSLELVEEINAFREKDGSKAKLEHKNLMAIIRDEFEEEINALKIQPVEYRDKKGEMRPMFELTTSQAKQILARESKFVRKALIIAIERMEDMLRASSSMPQNQSIPTITPETAHIHKAHILAQISNKYPGTSYAQVLDSYATKELTGDHILPLPEMQEKMYTATEIGEMLGGISGNKVGRLTNAHNLKTKEYGKLLHSKSRYSSKEVPNFYYYEKVIPILQSILNTA